MAGETRHAARALALLEALAAAPYRLDPFRALRRLECAYPDHPRLGEAARPADEPVRLGQQPSLAFTASVIASLSRDEARPPRLAVESFGVFGPNGPLPLHLTDYAHDRARNAGDVTLIRFLDVFHHRLLALFYRAHAEAEPVIARDRPSADPFTLFLGALFGMGLPSTRGRDLVSDVAKLHHAGLLAAQSRHAEGLETLIRGLFRVPARVEQFVRERVEIPPADRSRLGRARCALGRELLLGARVWLCTSRFRLVLGPLRRGRFAELLPGTRELEVLADAVRIYAGDELTWEFRLVLDRRDWRPLTLGASRLGWESWIGSRPSAWNRLELTIDPAARARARAPAGRGRADGERAAATEGAHA